MTQPLAGDAIGDTRTFTASQPGNVSNVVVVVTLLNPAGQTVNASSVGTKTYGTTVVDGVTYGTVTFSWTYVIPETKASEGLWYTKVKLTGDIVAVESDRFVVGRSPFLT